MWRPGKTKLQGLPRHLEDLHPLLLPSVHGASEPGVVAPGVLDMDITAAPVSVQSGGVGTVCSWSLEVSAAQSTGIRFAVPRADPNCCAPTPPANQQVSPSQVYVAAMDYFEHLSRPPSASAAGPGRGKSCFAPCRTSSASGSTQSEQVRSTFWGPSAGEWSLCVVDAQGLCCSMTQTCAAANNQLALKVC